MDPVAAALSNASALLLASITAVNASLGAVVAGDAGARKVCVRGGWEGDMAWFVGRGDGVSEGGAVKGRGEELFARSHCPRALS